MEILGVYLRGIRDYVITRLLIPKKVRGRREKKRLRRFVRRNFGEGQIISPQTDRKIVIRKGEYVVAVPKKDGKTVAVMIISQKLWHERGDRLTVPLWSTKQWGHYMSHCIASMRARYTLDLETIMKEK